MSQTLQAVTNTAPCLTAFLTLAGIDFVLRVAGAQHRCRIPYTAMQGTLADRQLVVNLTDDDDLLAVEFDGLQLEMKLQPKGHYFSWLQQIEKAQPCDINEARKQVRAAARAKAKSAAAVNAAAAAPF